MGVCVCVTVEMLKKIFNLLLISDNNLHKHKRELVTKVENSDVEKRMSVNVS